MKKQYSNLHFCQAYSLSYYSGVNTFKTDDQSSVDVGIAIVDLEIVTDHCTARSWCYMYQEKCGMNIIY